MKAVLLAYVFVIVTANISLASECGLEGSFNSIYEDKKIPPDKYPWLANIRVFINLKTDAYSQCGGSLINQQNIITAAHCVVDRKGKTYAAEKIYVYLGNAVTGITGPLAVDHVMIDESYNSEKLSHDFAILTLKNPVKFTDTISPICLPKSDDGIDQLMVSGWRTTIDGEDPTEILEADVQYTDDYECNRIQGRYVLKENDIPLEMLEAYLAENLIPKVHETHLCAVNKYTFGDACSVDSGGPLMHKNSDGQWVLIGVISGSWTDCGATDDIAGLYTRILIYKDSIREFAPNGVWVDL